MVCRNTGHGNNSPNHQEEVLQNPDLNVVSGDSDSEPEEPLEDDGLGYYRPILDYHPAGLMSDSDEEIQMENESPNLEDDNIMTEQCEASSSRNFPHIEPIEETLVRELWTKSTPKELDIELTDTKIDEVKMAMKNFSLPLNAIPEWAKNIPEDQWKDHLMKRLGNGTKD